MRSFECWQLDWLTDIVIFITACLSHIVPSSSMVTRVKYKNDKNEEQVGRFQDYWEKIEKMFVVLFGRSCGFFFLLLLSLCFFFFLNDFDKFIYLIWL